MKMVQSIQSQGRVMQNLKAAPFFMNIKMKIIMELLQILNFKAKGTMVVTAWLAK